MALSELYLKSEYHTTIDDVIENFFVPCLERSTSYDRITGFFSSASLVLVAHGLFSLINNAGKIRLILSTHITPADEEAIEKGYKDRSKVVAENMLARFEDPSDELSKGYLSMLSYLISHDILDIKVAVVVGSTETAMEHEKIGIFSDFNNNFVAFSGSGNATLSGLQSNSENYDVYCSWVNDDLQNRCYTKKLYFNNLWNGNSYSGKTPTDIRVISFPEAVKQRVFKYENYCSPEDYKKLDRKYSELIAEKMQISAHLPHRNATVKLRPYQKEAIENWKQNNYRGYLDMATGTGKTYTALAGIESLVNDHQNENKRFFCVIVVPYAHLVAQWDKDCRNDFKMKPILGVGSSKKWRDDFEDAVTSICLHQSRFECLIITTASLMSPFVIKGLSEIRSHVIFVADEAHNLGAANLSNIFKIDFKYRLGLSATITRAHDEIGTEKILNYFGPCCLHYGLREAIDNHYLCHYRYYPIVVWLDEDELSSYIELTKKISKLANIEDVDDANGDSPLRRLLLKRARIVAGCRMKVSALKKHIAPYASSYYSLIYCGAVNYHDSDNYKQDDDSQFAEVVSMLYQDLHMRVSPYTAHESLEQREAIKQSFVEKRINAIVAIKCLDEGVDIPCIQRAFILASSTNPKEFIQRRGRVLRQFDPVEKPYAEIFDFITLTRDPRTLRLLTDEQIAPEMHLAKRELARLEEFNELADNISDNVTIEMQIKDIYRFDEFDLEDWNDDK